MDEWEMFVRRLTMERQSGMPRWSMTPAPERTQHWMSDAPGLVETRRQELEALADAEKSYRRHLRRVA